MGASELLYPAFHYVPEPDAVDLGSFPRSLVFQFGYTCTGLEGYISRSNTCRAGVACRYHHHHGVEAEATSQQHSVGDDSLPPSAASDTDKEEGEQTESRKE